MRVVANVTLIAFATLFAGTAFAEGTYIGLSRATPGEAYADFSTARNVRNDNSPVALKLYRGINLTDRYGIEAGYGDFGMWKIADPTVGSAAKLRIASKLAYVAGTATMPVSESFSLFGKLGLPANKATTDRSGFQASSSTSFVRPMLGLGTDLRSRNILQLCLNSITTAKTRISNNKNWSWA